MSSNIKVQRVCQHCGKEFTARTTVTRFCSATCSKKAYKARLKNSKIESSNVDTKRVKLAPIEQVSGKAFLTVKDVSLLLSCSVRTVYRLIDQGAIKAVNIAERKTLVRRADIDTLFVSSQEKEPVKQPHNYNVADCYNMKEIQSKFGISEKALNEIVKRNSIPRIRSGKYSYVPKSIIESLLK